MDNLIGRFDRLPHGAAPRRNTWLSHAIGALATGLILVVLLAVNDRVEGRHYLVLFVVPVLVAAYLGGLGSGLVATALCAAVAKYFFIPSRHSFLFEGSGDFVEWVAFVLCAVLTSILLESLLRARRAVAPNVRQDALGVSDERARAMVATALDAVIAMDRSGAITEWNSRAEATFGWQRSEAVGCLLEIIIPERYRDAHRRGLKRFLTTGEAVVLNKRMELSGLHRSGREFPIEIAITPLTGSGHDAETFCAFLRDISERKRAEQSLRESEERFRAMADTAPVLIWVSGTNKLCTWFNRGWLEFVGRSMEQEVGNGWVDNVHPDDLERCINVYTSSFDACKPFSMEYRLRRHDGQWRWLLDTGVPRYGTDKELAGYIGSCVDITERRESAEALRVSTQHYQTLCESLPHLVWTCTPDGECDYLSRQWVEYTGKSEEEQLGYGWLDAVYPDDRGHVQSEWTQATTRGDRFDVEFRIRRYDGSFRWFKTRAIPLRNSAGRVVKWFGSNTDFQDYRAAAGRLQSQLERLNLLDRITTAIGQREDLQSIFQVVVRSLEDLMPIDFCCVCLCGASKSSLTVSCVGAKSQQLSLELAKPERVTLAIDQNGLARCLLGKLVYEPDVIGLPFAFPELLARGGMRSVVIAPLQVEGNVFGVLVSARRVAGAFSSSDCEFLRQLADHVALAAHQKQLHLSLEEAYQDLRQSQEGAMEQERLRVLGQMASGIAHDINNAMSPAALYAEMLLERETGLSARGREWLETISNAIDDVASTVARMREFYRQRETQIDLAPVDLNALVRRVIDLTRARWLDIPQQRGVVIDLQMDLAEELPLTLGIDSEIRNALTNLVLNAVDAMPGGGILSLRTRARPATKATLARVTVEVADTGIGMDAETRRRCLEPFFTTKGERGTGLGLAMVYGIVQRHGADLEIDSVAGAGTTMRLSFPLSTGATAPVAATIKPGSVPPMRILVIDDDTLVLKSLRDTLEAEGHAVTTADGGQHGIETFLAAQQDKVPFAVVITDLGMPYVDGRKVASAVKAASSSTPIVLLTGWGQRLIADGDVPAEVDLVLNKPARLAEIRSALATCAGVQQGDELRSNDLP